MLRIKAETPATGKLPFDANRARRADYSDYGLPPLEFLMRHRRPVSRPMLS